MHMMITYDELQIFFPVMVGSMMNNDFKVTQYNLGY